MPRLIKNPGLKRELKKLGLESINLYKDDGYFFIDSDEDLWADRISGLYTSSILCNSFKDQCIAGWVNDIVSILCGTYHYSDPRELAEDWQRDLYSEFCKWMREDI